MSWCFVRYKRDILGIIEDTPCLFTDKGQCVMYLHSLRYTETETRTLNNSSK